MGGTSEYREVRLNLSYKPVIDLIGEDFPLHPEYLYILDIICAYYGTPFTDVIEYTLLTEQHKEYRGVQGGLANKLFNRENLACLKTIAYFLYAQYECNVNVIAVLFGIQYSRVLSLVETFCKDFDKSDAVKADYAIIFGKLLELEG